MRPAAASAGPDFRYVAVGDPGGGTSWVILMDLAAKTTEPVAEIEIKVPAGAQAGPSVELSSTSNGRRVMIVVAETTGRTQLFLLDARAGSVRMLTTLDSFASAVISSDGARYAFTDRSTDASRNGVWVASTSDGAARRVLADDPERAGSPLRPLEFSSDGSQLAAVVDFGPGDPGIAIVGVSAEARIRGTTVDRATLLQPGGAFSWLGAPEDAWAWEGAGPFGGDNAVYSYDVRTGSGTEVYRPPSGAVLHDLKRSPKLDRFMTNEGPGVIGEGGRGAIWVRTREGGATKVADMTMTGPSFPWWSPDGSRLYAFTGGDDSIGSVVDLLTGEGVLSFCRRSPARPCV